VSASIWTRCAARTERKRLVAEPWRAVEAQHVNSTRALVDSLAEQALLERLLDDAKPPVPPDREFQGLHYLLSTPFRYPPLRYGSRFGRRHERGIWYGSDQRETALAELSYYRLLFFAGTRAALLPNTTPFSLFRARVATAAGVDLTLPPFAEHLARISSKVAYAASQQLGTEMRAAGVEAFRYASARDPAGGTNIGLFTPAAFAAKRPRGPAETWHCTVTTAGDVEWLRQDVVTVRRLRHARAEFLVRGELPSPAV
jgi:hypothetical protein